MKDLISCSTLTRLPRWFTDGRRKLSEGDHELQGVEDDGPPALENDCGLTRVQEELVNLGRSGGQQTVCGGYEKILDTLQGNGHYALVVIGNVFLSKGHSTRTRRTRELAMNIRDRLKAPVITTDEMKSRFLFGKRQAVSLGVFLGLVILIYGLVFTHQKQLVNFLSGPTHRHFKGLVSIAVGLFIPAIAFIYGKVAELALKLINID